MPTRMETKIYKAVGRLPQELQENAWTSVERLRHEAGLSTKGLRRLLRESGENLELRCIGAWMVALLRDESLAATLEEVLSPDSPPILLWEAAKTLSQLGRGHDLFRVILTESEDSAKKQAAAFALGQLREVKGIEVLAAVLADETQEPAVRAQAAESLGYIGDSLALEPLVAAAEDASPEVRFWSAFALGKLRDHRALAVLKRLASTDHSLVEGWWEVSREANAAIQEIQRGGLSRP